MIVQPDKCPCCRAMLHHCEHCWNAYHNGLRDKDYIRPVYYGESLFSWDDWPDDEISNQIKDEGLKNMPIKPNKSRPYVEGDYNHSAPGTVRGWETEK